MAEYNVCVFTYILDLRKSSCGGWKFSWIFFNWDRINFICSSVSLISSICSSINQINIIEIIKFLLIIISCKSKPNPSDLSKITKDSPYNPNIYNLDSLFSHSHLSPKSRIQRYYFHLFELLSFQLLFHLNQHF